MKPKNKLKPFIIFITLQIILSTVAIITFQQLFGLKLILILVHLFVISCIHFFLIGLGIIIVNIQNNLLQRLTTYLLATLYSIFNVLLYFGFLLAFGGKTFNHKIYTLQIALGYLKYLNQFITHFAINSLFVYTVLLFIPVAIFVFLFLKRQMIFDGLVALNPYILKYNFIHSRKAIQYAIIVGLLFIGFIFVKRNTIIFGFNSVEEPVFCVYLSGNNPFQGMAIFTDNEDFTSRKQYPKKITFDKKNIVIIVVDALRSDHLSLFGYKRKTSPFLDSLYTSGNLKKVKRSFSTAGASFGGINSILRSKTWANLGYQNFSIQHLLKDQGYALNFLVSGDHTNFYGLKSFYGKDTDFDYYIDGSTTKKYIIGDDRIIFEGFQNIKNYNNHPAYFQLHLNSAHSGGIRLPKYMKYLPASTNFDPINYTNRYDNGILQADDYIKSIFKILKIKGYLKNSLVVITADHGEALGENGIYGHSFTVNTNQTLIPILIYDPEKVTYTNTNYATTIDIAPTIIDRLGLPIPKTWEGNSLYTRQIKTYTYHQMGEYYAIIHTQNNQQWKYLFNAQTKEESLYDLNKDLYQTQNCIKTANPNFINKMRTHLSHFRIASF